MGNRVPGPRPRKQYLVALLLVAAVTLLGLLLLPLIGYQAVSFVFLLAVITLALFADAGPILAAAALSALSWDFLFIPPRFTFYIARLEDIMMLGTYFVVALTTGILNARVRAYRGAVRRREQRTQMLAQSERLYRTLFNSISHEFRTPITAIAGAVSSLQHPKLGADPAMRATLIGEIQEANERLNRLVQNLLDMARLQSGTLKPNLQYYDVGNLISVALSRTAPELARHRVIAGVAHGLQLVAMDFVLLEQVLTNLLRNAAAYTPPGTEIQVTADATDDSVIFMVADNGPGLTPEVLARIFDKFYRGPDAAPGGTGLGLSICRGLVEAHHGSLRAESTPQAGTRFIVSLPLQALPAEPRPLSVPAT